MIAIIDYGMGNLRSVEKAIAQVGYEPKVTNDVAVVKNARGIILPGVGAFADAMENLEKHDLINTIQNVIAEGKPFLGICLGLQLLFSGSEENGWHEGLDIFSGKVKRLPGGVKIPHMGWNQIEIVKESAITKDISQKSNFYFVHSYHVSPDDRGIIATTTDYGINFTSIVSKDNVYGIQFHPEKSSTLGLRILKNFGELVEKC